MKKLSFSQQITVGVIFLFFMHIASWIFKQGFFLNVVWVVYGLLFIVHPVYPDSAEGVRNIRQWVRFAGLLCVLAGILTRFGAPR